MAARTRPAEPRSLTTWIQNKGPRTADGSPRLGYKLSRNNPKQE